MNFFQDFLWSLLLTIAIGTAVLFVIFLRTAGLFVIRFCCKYCAKLGSRFVPRPVDLDRKQQPDSDDNRKPCGTEAAKAGKIGLAVVIANEYEGEDKLEGTAKDKERWEEAFRNLQFDVRTSKEVGLNANKTEMLHLIDSLSQIHVRDADVPHCRNIAFVFSGHGYSGVIISQDSKELNLESDIFPRLLCRSLYSRRKLIFVDACRTTKSDQKGFAFTSKMLEGISKSEVGVGAFVAYAPLDRLAAPDLKDGSHFSKFTTEEIQKDNTISAVLDKAIGKVDQHSKQTSKSPYTRPIYIYGLSGELNLYQEAKQRVHQAERDGPLVESEEDIMLAQDCEHEWLCATGVSQDISSRMVTGRSLCNAQHTMQGPQMICFLSDILKSIPLGPNREKFVKNYRLVRKLGGEDVNESQKYWEIIWAEQNEDPLTQSACFFSGMLSSPGNLEYILKEWGKLSENLNRSDYIYAVLGSMFALYLVAWTIQNWVEKNGSDPEHVYDIPLAYNDVLPIRRTKEGAMNLVDYCIKKTEGVINFVLTPYFSITMLRWKFETKCDSGTLNETGASCFLKGVDETFQKCWSLEQDWMKADAFGAMVSAVNLKIEIALYFKGRGQNDKFHSIKREAMHFLNRLNEYFESNQSLITIYDRAWLFSVRSKCFRVDDNETEARQCAELSASDYLECSRNWRAVEEAEHSGNRKLIEHCKRVCLQSKLS